MCMEPVTVRAAPKNCRIIARILEKKGGRAQGGAKLEDGLPVGQEVFRTPNTSAGPAGNPALLRGRGGAALESQGRGRKGSESHPRVRGDRGHGRPKRRVK